MYLYGDLKSVSTHAILIRLWHHIHAAIRLDDQ